MMAISLSTCKPRKVRRVGEGVREHMEREEAGGEEDMETVRERERERDIKRSLHSIKNAKLTYQLEPSPARYLLSTRRIYSVSLC